MRAARLVYRRGWNHITKWEARQRLRTPSSFPRLYPQFTKDLQLSPPSVHTNIPGTELPWALMSHWGYTQILYKTEHQASRMTRQCQPGSCCPFSRGWAGSVSVHLVFTMLHNKHTPHPQWLTKSKKRFSLSMKIRLVSCDWTLLCLLGRSSQICQSQGRDKMAEHCARQAYFRSNLQQSYSTRQQQSLQERQTPL